MTTKQAVNHLYIELKKDEAYWLCWKSNIAMSFKDEWASDPLRDVHEIANKSADRFLTLLCQGIVQ